LETYFACLALSSSSHCLEFTVVLEIRIDWGSVTALAHWREARVQAGKSKRAVTRSQRAVFFSNSSVSVTLHPRMLDLFLSFLRLHFLT
jgi:hypothetical protein